MISLAWQCLRENGKEENQDAGVARWREMQVCLDGSFPDWREHRPALGAEKAVRGNQERKCVRELESERAHGMPERTPAEGELRAGRPIWQKVVKSWLSLRRCWRKKGRTRRAGSYPGVGRSEVPSLPAWESGLYQTQQEEWKGGKRWEVYWMFLALISISLFNYHSINPHMLTWLRDIKKLSSKANYSLWSSQDLNLGLSHSIDYIFPFFFFFPI